MLAMEQQATCLLMKKCGLLEEEALLADKENAFREQFLDPVKTKGLFVWAKVEC